MSKKASEYQQLETTDQTRVFPEEKTEPLQLRHPVHLLHTSQQQYNILSGQLTGSQGYGVG